MAGSVDFSASGLRYKQLLKAIQKKRPIARKLPLSPDMLTWFGERMRPSWCEGKFRMIWAALILGFAFLLRGSEIRNLKWCDINVCLEEGQGDSPYLMICIQKSKTDQEGRGVFRSLFRNGSSLCPYEG